MIDAYNKSQLGFTPTKETANVPDPPRIEGMVEYYDNGKVYQGPSVLVPPRTIPPIMNYTQAIVFGAPPPASTSAPSTQIGRAWRSASSADHRESATCPPSPPQPRPSKVFKRTVTRPHAAGGALNRSSTFSWSPASSCSRWPSRFPASWASSSVSRTPLESVTGSSSASPTTSRSSATRRSCRVTSSLSGSPSSP